MLTKTSLEGPAWDESCLATMKAWLGSLLFLATLVTASNAGCTFENRENLPNQKSNDCIDAGGIHPVNSYWVKDCNWCFCGEKSITCCSKTPIPASYDKAKCYEQFNAENCTYSVVERANPQKTCPVKGWKM